MATITDPNDIVLKYHEDAEKVLAALRDILKMILNVTVQDLHDLVGLPSTYEDSRRGWKNLDNVKIKTVPNGYSLVLPETEAI